jgi:hypothetical protein
LFLLHHTGIAASIFRVNELVLKDAEALGTKDMSFIWDSFNGIWPGTAMEQLAGERTKLKQNGAAYKLQAAEMGFTAVTGQTWRYEIVKMRTGQTWRCETLTEDWTEFTGLDKTGDVRDSNRQLDGIRSSDVFHLNSHHYSIIS